MKIFIMYLLIFGFHIILELHKNNFIFLNFCIFTAVSKKDLVDLLIIITRRYLQSKKGIYSI